MIHIFYNPFLVATEESSAVSPQVSCDLTYGANYLTRCLLEVMIVT